jgi:hypothetical protein
MERNEALARPGQWMTVLPKNLRTEIARQIERTREVWKADREAGLAGVHMPGALARKFRKAAETFEWFWLFPAKQPSLDPACGIQRRHHMLGQVYNEAIKRAADAAGIEKRVAYKPAAHAIEPRKENRNHETHESSRKSKSWKPRLTHLAGEDAVVFKWLSFRVFSWISWLSFRNSS